MKTHKRLYQRLCSEENLIEAYRKARKRKSLKPYVKEFAKNLTTNLKALREELTSKTYTPRPLITFVIRDPKTRKIRKSDFRDRIVHHAVVNILEPIFEPLFIHDSFANRKGKGTLKALERFNDFKRKASKNNSRTCHVLKADVRHYFEEVRHSILLSIIGRKVKDNDILSLISKILKNYSPEVGMPLGNLTSQFFQNIYLNELDQFVKHTLRMQFYIRYVDDFVILSDDKVKLQFCQEQIDRFLKEKLQLRLHENKTKILKLHQGIPFLGFRNFYHHRLPRKSNLLNMKRQLVKESFDSLCVYLEGWIAYAKHANTFNLRNKVAQILDSNFPGQISLLQIGRTMRYAQ